jgi:hypothetical protein
MGFLKKLFAKGQPAPKLPVHPDDKELITEYDIQWWESLTLDDLKAFEQQDHVAQFALYIKLVKEDGLSSEEAVRQVRKIHPFYYATLDQRDDEPLGYSGEDAKLPYILKDRINKAVMKYIRKMDRNEIQSASSMNAIVRNLIRAGKV